MKELFKIGFLFCLMFMISCAPMMKQPMSTSEARLGANSPAFDELKSLPEPLEPIVVAVYKFRDQTGQYKPSDVGSNWSTAVTQGATSILIRSLEESRWFVPIEREGLGNLLNERKIIRSSRANYMEEDEDPNQLLPPLLFAGIILEGGIVSYETNVLTGGAGIRYFGTGGSGQYREDRVTIYLRAISTSNGRILKTVHTTKTILSQKLDFGVFRYVSLKRLLEVETGFTYNEPSDIAVQEAIDKAVQALIIEGILDDLWAMKNPDDINSLAIKEYIKEKIDNKNTDYMGFEEVDYRQSFKLSGRLGTFLYDGDYPAAAPRPMAEFSVGFFQDFPFSIEAGFGIGQLVSRDLFTSIVQYSNADLQYRLFSHYKFTPFIKVGAGFLISTGNNPFENWDTHFRKNSYGYIKAGFGYEYMPSRNIGIDLTVNNYRFFNDYLDDVVQGKYNDYFWGLNLGFNYYFGKND